MLIKKNKKYTTSSQNKMTTSLGCRQATYRDVLGNVVQKSNQSLLRRDESLRLMCSADQFEITDLVSNCLFLAFLIILMSPLPSWSL